MLPLCYMKTEKKLSHQKLLTYLITICSVNHNDICNKKNIS